MPDNQSTPREAKWPLRVLAGALCLGLIVAVTSEVDGQDKPAAKTIEGDWHGRLKTGTDEIQAIFHISKQDATFVATLDVPDQGGHGIPCQVLFQKDTVHISVASLNGQYVGKLSADGNDITGAWQQLGKSTPMTLVRTHLQIIPQAIVLVYWAVVIALAALFLRLACTLCQTDMPGWKRAIISAILVTGLAFLTFDFTGYIVMRSMRGMSTVIPEWYSYQHWLREPIALKVKIIIHAGILRYLPFIFALCVAGTLQVIILEAQVTFRWALVIVMLQWAATGVAAYILSLLIGLVWTGASMQTTPVAHKQPAGAMEGESKGGSLQVARQEAGDAAENTREFGQKAWANFKEYSDPYLNDLNEALAPIVRHLPEPVREFLDNGGWWGLLAVAAIVAVLWLRSIVRKLLQAVPKFKRRKPPKVRQRFKLDLKEDLEMLGEGFIDEGPQRILVKGLPARLRLVVLSAGTRETTDLTEEMVDRILDWLKPGLAQAAAIDFPRVRVWQPFYSAEGFSSAFGAKVPIPESKGEKSHWILVFGQVTMGKALINVGLGFYADDLNTLRHLRVTDEQWHGLFTVKQTEELLAARK